MTVCIILITRSLVLRFWFDWWFRWAAKRSIQVYFIRALNWNCVIDVLKLNFSSHVWMRKTAFFPQQNKLNVFNQNKNSNFCFSQNERVLRNNHFSVKFFSLQKSKQSNRKCENMKIWITACEIGWKFYVVIRRIVAMPIIIIFAFVWISKKVKITAYFFSRFVTFFFWFASHKFNLINTPISQCQKTLHWMASI